MSNLDKAIAILNRIANPEIRDRAIDEVTAMSIIDKKANWLKPDFEIKEVLRYGFYWGSTHEGVNYWHKIANSEIEVLSETIEPLFTPEAIGHLKHAYNAGVEASCGFDEWFNEYCKSKNEQK